MAVYRPDIPPHVAQLIRHLPPELKRSVKQALRSFKFKPILRRAASPRTKRLVEIQGETFRLIHEVDRKARLIRIFALGHRREVY